MFIETSNRKKQSFAAFIGKIDNVRTSDMNLSSALRLVAFYSQCADNQCLNDKANKIVFYFFVLIVQKNDFDTLIHGGQRANRTSMEHFEEDLEGFEKPLLNSDELPDFIVMAVLKRDIFSETRVGFFIDAPGIRIVRRVVTASPLWSRPLAWLLAKREIRGLKNLRGLNGMPQLIATDKDGLFRSWTEGTPLHLARPDTQEFYKSGFKLLRNMRRAGVTHNDLAKPQNWLMSPDGKAAIIDFQLASAHKKRSGYLYRYFSYEDFRHLLKQKKSFARELLTPTEIRILKNRSWPSKLWLATGKKVYNFVTKGIFNWSDGEGTGDRIQIQGPTIKQAFIDEPNIKNFALTTYSLPAKGVGLYVFVETDLDEKAIRRLLKGQKVELIQPVKTLPLRKDGTIRDDILRLVAMNELNDLGELLEREPKMKEIVQPIMDNRLNFTDRRVYEYEINRN